MGSNKPKQPLAGRDRNEPCGGSSVGDESRTTTESNAVAGLQADGTKETDGTETQDTGWKNMEHLRTKTIEVPAFAVDRQGIYVRNIEGKLSLEQARILNGLTEELRASGVELEDGQKVRKAIHAVRWLLERIK